MENMNTKMGMVWQDVYGAIGYKDDNKLVVTGPGSKPVISVFCHLQLRQESDTAPIMAHAGEFSDNARNISGSDYQRNEMSSGLENPTDLTEPKQEGSDENFTGNQQGHMRGPDSMFNAIEMQITNYRISEELKERETFLETIGQWRSL